MWCKAVLFAVFLCLLFILSRLREAIAYYEGGYLASRLLDPVSLSAKKLKLLLDQRGISYAGVVEKKELTDLVETTGDASEGELETASQEEEVSSYTEFKGGSHFYEEVEDSKDSVWVVQVVHSPHAPFMSNQEWSSFVHKVSRFGVRTGYFDCTLDKKLCERKGWYSARLVLALPQGQKAKDNVVLKNYIASSHTQAVLDWVNYNLASRIKQIQTMEELNSDWLRFDSDKQKQNLRVVLLSSLNVPPMFYSVLSVRFTGRVKFGTINVGMLSGRNIVNATKWTKVPSYLIIMPEQVYVFGPAAGEYPNFNSMAMFLKTLQPEVNDIFLLSLIVVNIMCWFELALARGNLFKRLGSLLWHICKWNCLLILLCFPVLGMFQLPYMDMVLDAALKLLRITGTSSLASLVRADWLAYYTNHIPFLCVIFAAYASVVGLLHYKYRGPAPDSTSGAAQQSNRPILNWDTYANFLFQPISGAVPFMPSTRELEIDAGMEMLIGQLSLPNIWLGPMISSEYLKDLPVWKYTGPNVESDIGSDNDCPTPTPRIESEGEDMPSRPDSPAASLDQSNDQGKEPAMFVCEKCRALQESLDMSEESREERAQAQLESESACAKYLMDGNYKCMCKHNQTNTHDKHGSHSERFHNHAQTASTPPSSGSASPTMGRTVTGSASPTMGRTVPGSASPTLGRTVTGSGSPTPARTLTQSARKACNSKSDLEDDTDQTQSKPRNTETYHPPPGMLPVMDCSICLEGLKYGVALCGLPCKHSFHHECIMRWLNQYNHLCPLCRWPAYKAKPCSLHQHSE